MIKVSQILGKIIIFTKIISLENVLRNILGKDDNGEFPLIIVANRKKSIIYECLIKLIINSNQIQKIKVEVVS